AAIGAIGGLLFTVIVSGQYSGRLFEQFRTVVKNYYQAKLQSPATRGITDDSETPVKSALT
ncbi:MAG: hypothetical protein ABEK50_04635, partial [bacterium]